MKFLYALLSCVFLLSCNGKKNKPVDTCWLEATGQVKSFPLDAEVRYNAFYLYTFSEKGKEYLSFLNYRTNQILFYDLDTGHFLFKMELDAEGPDGIVQASGY